MSADVAAAGMIFVILMLILVLAIIALVVFFFVFWIMMLVDCATRKFRNDNDRIVWILVIILAGIIGALIYYFVIKHPDKH